MSGIAGIFNRNKHKICDVTANNFLLNLSHWNPDNRALLKQNHIALFHAMLWNSPESKLEQLPRKQELLSITMDARLDNRKQLAQELGLSNTIHTSDSHFILAAYIKWQEHCPEHLLGDFAFSIWDHTKQQLFCARDQIGVKQFYFHMTDQLFVFANDLKALTGYPTIAHTIDEESVANFLTNSQLTRLSHTFFSEIQKLPAGHTLTISESHQQQRCYWDINKLPQKHTLDERSAILHLRELLTLAVHDRMRSSYPVTSHLSGGLDSSSIAVIASRKLRKEGTQLLAFNWLHEPAAEDDSSHYEWSHSTLIAEKESISHYYTPLTAEDIAQARLQHSILYGESAIFWYEYPIRQAAGQAGSRTILSGWGGDELVTYHGQSYYCDMFLRGKIIALLKELKSRIAREGSKRPFRRLLGLVYRNIFLVLLPGILYRRITQGHYNDEQTVSFVKKSFQPAIQCEQQKPSPLSFQQQPTIRKHMLAFWHNGHIQSRIESWAAAAISSRLEYCYPLLDRRIIEFILCTPAKHFVRQGLGRYLARKACDDLIPAEILWENAKIEHQRVNKLFKMTVEANASLLKRTKFRAIHSRYIDTSTLTEAIAQISSSDPSSNDLKTLSSIENALAILLI